MAGGKGTTFDNDLLKLIFNGNAIAGIADNAASGPLTSLFLSLHTADPGAGGAQTTNEATYGSYARMPVTRSPVGFTVSGASVTLTVAIIFPTASSGTETETYAAVGTNVTGSGKILYRGPITPTLNITTGIAPQLTAGTTITES